MFRTLACSQMRSPNASPIESSIHRSILRSVMSMMSLAFVIVFAVAAVASQTLSFESPTYTIGNINGQDGWIKSGSYDSTVSSTSVPGFGAQSFRISNAVTSGTFGDQTFSKPVVNEAGETTAQNGGMSGGVRKQRFVTEFSIASAVPGAQQTGLGVTLSPDRGDGARMSWLRFEDRADGIHVLFVDYSDNAPFGTAITGSNDPLGCGAEDNFFQSDIATLNRANVHKIKLVIDFADGPRNDVVSVYVNGTLVKTGTSWEDYFRFCEGNPTRTVDSILFRASGVAAPGTIGNGFFFDGLTMSSAVIGATVTKITSADIAPAYDPQKWLFYNDVTDTINNTLGSFVTGPSTPPNGSGSAQISVTGNERRNLATYRFSGTPLASITTLKYSIYNPSAGNGQGPNASAYINFNVDFNGTDTFQRRLVFLPLDNGGVTANVWKEFDAINSGSALWRYSGPAWPIDGVPGTTPKTWSQIVTQYAGIRIRVTDAFMGIKVGEPYPNGYTENIDSFTFGTASGTTVFDFEPLPLVVDDDFAQCPSAGYTTIQSAINAATPGATIQVCAGNYQEDVNVNKANIILQGAGVDISTITGPHLTGGGDTLLITASGVTIDGFTITRTGNTVSDWATNTQNQGINISSSTGVTIQNSKITGNRNGIYVGQSSYNTTIRRNIIDFNRTGVHIVDNNNSLVEENFIRNNWTMGILYRTEGGPAASVHTVRNNNISANWYSEVENRDTPGTAIFNVSGNYIGTTTPTRVIATSLEPSYTSQIPVAYGGTAVPPASHPTIAGPQSARVDYSPFLNSGTDMQPGTPGFQGDFANLTVNSDSSQANAPTGNIQEGINLALSGGTVFALAGTYTGNVDINKAVTLKGTPTFAGSLTTSAAGAVVSPGFSPGIMNSGNVSLNSGSTINIEINGTTVGTQYDQLNVTGSVALGNANLNVTTGYSAVAGNSFVIVNNDGADAVSGTFNGLAEGATFNVSGTTFQISYIGGTGNDIVLTVATVTCNNVVIPTGISTLSNQQVTVPINIDSVTGRNILGYSSSVTYDQTKLTFVGINQVGTLSSGMTVTVNSGTPGVLNIFAFGTIPPTGSGALLELRFFVNGAISAVPTPVNFTSFSLNEGVPCANTQNGSVVIISSTITGTVTYANAPSVTPVPLTTLNAVGSVNVATSSAMNGTYTLSGLGAGAYTVTPSKTAQPIATVNGITPTDSALIAQHGAGFITLNANQLLAADVTANGTVSPLDAAYIAQWSVGIANPGITGTWKFIPAIRNYPLGVVTPQSNQDYSGILMGDVTGNWSPTLLGGTFAEQDYNDPSDSKDVITASAPSMEVAAGSPVNIPIEINDLTGKNVIAYQFDLNYDPTILQPQDVGADIAGTVSDGMNVVSNSPEPGLLKVAVYGVTPVNGRGVLVNLRFSAVGGVGSSTRLDISGLLMNEGGLRVRMSDGRLAISKRSENTIRGKLLNVLGTGVSRAHVTITGTGGDRRVVVSSQFGDYEFGGLQAGESYILAVNHKRYTFLPQNVVVVDGLTTLDMIADQ